MASYTARGWTNEYQPNEYVNTVPDSDDSMEMDSDTELFSKEYFEHVTAVLATGDRVLHSSHEQMGLFNRHNFMVHNYNEVCKSNEATLGLLYSRMIPVLPIGGSYVSGLDKRRSWNKINNNMAMIVGWISGLLPIFLAVVTAYLRSLMTKYICIYLLLSLIILYIGLLTTMMHNCHLFIRSCLMISLPVNCSLLKSLRNSFMDYTCDQLEEIPAITQAERQEIASLFELINKWDSIHINNSSLDVRVNYNQQMACSRKSTLSDEEEPLLIGSKSKGTQPAVQSTSIEINRIAYECCHHCCNDLMLSGEIHRIRIMYFSIDYFWRYVKLPVYRMIAITVHATFWLFMAIAITIKHSKV